MSLATNTVPQRQRAELGVTEQPTLDTWQTAPTNRWVFCHFDELLPTARISRISRSSRAGEAGVERFRGVHHLVERLEATCTDALLIERGGDIIGEWYAKGFGPDRGHLLMSVSKSLCAIVTGSLIDEGWIEPDQRLDHYIPRLAGSAFGDATVQQMLDMVAAVDYREEYTDETSEVQSHDRAARWRSPRPGDPEDTYTFLTTLRCSKPHGQQFQYSSAVTDALGWLIEEVTGERYATVLSERLWAKLGAEDDARISIDRGGCAIANGGMVTTARDLSKVGRLMLNGGVIGNTRIVSSSWVQDTLRGGDRRHVPPPPPEASMPNFTYKNQWWHSGNERGNVYAVGIHGQFIWLDPLSDTVIVKFSSLPNPVSYEDTRRQVSIFSDLIAELEQ